MTRRGSRRTPCGRSARRCSPPSASPRTTPPSSPTASCRPTCGATSRTASCGCPGTPRGSAPAPCARSPTRRSCPTPVPCCCSTAATASARCSPSAPARLAVERARTHGVGVVGVRNSNHFGTAMYFTRRAAAGRVRRRPHHEREPGDGPLGRPGEAARHQPVVDRRARARRPGRRRRHREHRGRPRQDLPGEEPRASRSPRPGRSPRTARRRPIRRRACSA